MNRYFRIAKEISLKSNHGVYKIGSVLVLNKQIVGKGFNLIDKSHSIIRKFNQFQTIHAEVAAIIKCRHNHNLKGSTMYVFRQHKDGSDAICRPCSTCLKIMQMFGIKQVIYTTDNGYDKIRL